MFQVNDPSEMENLEIFEGKKPSAGHSERPPGPAPGSANPLLWQGKFAPAFWTVTGAISLAVNIALMVTLVVIARELFTLKALLNDQLIGGLYGNFQKMDAAVIETSITVEDVINVNDTINVVDTIPVVFDLPLQQDTVVRLSADTPISNALVNINTPFFSVTNAPARIVLPADTELPIILDMSVPVSQTIPIELVVPVDLEVPISLDVPVSIPLNQTQLHEPFVGLQEVLYPYQTMLTDAPDTWAEAACLSGPILCWLLGPDG